MTSHRLPYDYLTEQEAAEIVNGCNGDRAAIDQLYRFHFSDKVRFAAGKALRAEADLAAYRARCAVLYPES